PLPNIMLHPEDATSKVFHAIGRCFLSVDNRAMTIKDIAEMTLNLGLVCQKYALLSSLSSPYSQLPYNNNLHPKSCLSMRGSTRSPISSSSHTLWHTTDDDLVPALHSRVEGAPLQRQPLDSIRHTNFRRGTIIWYLSKVSGVSCPFSRAGILLLNYPASTSNIKPQKRSHDPMERRKRLISRRCRVTGRLSESASPSPSSEDEPERPPKVKLTPRLRPS
ncbi:hypothetical protein EDD22DRAFT_766105, partial [Suillus occidentalis]